MEAVFSFASFILERGRLSLFTAQYGLFVCSLHSGQVYLFVPPEESSFILAQPKCPNFDAVDTIIYVLPVLQRAKQMLIHCAIMQSVHLVTCWDYWRV